MKYFFQYDSGIIDFRTDIPEGHENDPYITVEDDFELLPRHRLELDFEHNEVRQIEIPAAPEPEKVKTTEELIIDAINEV